MVRFLYLQFSFFYIYISNKSTFSAGISSHRYIGHIADHLKAISSFAAAIPPNPDVIMTEMPVAVPVDEEISFAPADEEIIMVEPVVKNQDVD